MRKRQAKIDALNIVMWLINAEIDSPTGLTGEYNKEDRAVVVEYLDRIVQRLEQQRDDAAYTQFMIDDRKSFKREMAEHEKAKEG